MRSEQGQGENHYLLNGFVENDIFDGISSAAANVSDLGVCKDLLEMFPEPLVLTFGANDAEVDEDVLQQMNTVGGMGVKLLD